MPGRVRVVRALALGVSVVAVTALAACSNDESPAQKRPQSGSGTATTVNGVQEITVHTGPDLRFHPSTIVVHPGKVRITLVNQRSSGSGGPPHNLVFPGPPNAYTGTISQGQRISTRTFTAPSPGRYQFVCTIHVQQGQTGTLVVKAGSSGS